MKVSQKEIDFKLKKGAALPLMEAFYTIQGEGYHRGRPAYFIRLGGCDVGCHWCDVKESWDADAHPLLDVEEIAQNAVDCPANIVVITGGEPLMYKLDHLCRELKNHGRQIHLETSGAYELSGYFDWICLSPKKTVPPKSAIFEHADELKCIIYNKSDFQWAEQNAKGVNENCHLLLQPEWSREKEMLPMIIEYVKQYPQWGISLQEHKYMNIP